MTATAPTTESKAADSSVDTNTVETKSEETDDAKTEPEPEPEPLLGVFERPKVVGKYCFGTNKSAYLLEFESANDCNGCLFVEGLSGIGTTSTVVAAYIIGELKLPLVAVFYSPSLPAMSSIHKMVPSSPIRIYGNKDVAVAVGDYPLAPEKFGRLIFTVSKCLMQFAYRHQCRHIISVDGFPIKSEVEELIQKIAKRAEQQGLSRQESLEKEPTTKDLFSTLGYLTTDKEIALQLQALKHNGLKSGQILGVTGAMLQIAFIATDASFYRGDEGKNVIAAAAATDADSDSEASANLANYGYSNNNSNVEELVVPPFTAMLSPDPVSVPDRRGGLLVMKLLQTVFGLEIESTKLEVEAERLANKVMETVNMISKQYMKQRVQKAKPPPGMYY